MEHDCCLFCPHPASLSGVISTISPGCWNLCQGSGYRLWSWTIISFLVLGLEQFSELCLCQPWTAYFSYCAYLSQLTFLQPFSIHLSCFSFLFPFLSRLGDTFSLCFLLLQYLVILLMARFGNSSSLSQIPHTLPPGHRSRGNCTPDPSWLA